ncbi:energy transducer TonB [Stenotrophomonas sp. 24(2023)]|uniref:energy transducer TonB n=1 Tax=Stenotrophomonas sp. 24(2023) TaxID=3068324 RepID=UPI0027E146D2|nr:energy transducer TonB [Stenotrophomonas sp. 24(2023)]WMJ70730.1 energy transducer TonB [Stenotrophomonas sp. 24(2023)]
MPAPRLLALALLLGPGLLSLSHGAAAQNTRQVRATAEATMVLSGAITIGIDGAVEGMHLDRPDEVDPQIAAFIQKTVGAWRFQPTRVEGEAVPAQARMRVRLLGKALPDGGTEVALRSVDFSQYDGNATDVVTAGSLRPPAYPGAALTINGQGTVLLAIKVDRAGRVADAVVEQVNLTSIGPERTMAELRTVFSKASLAAARKWTFQPPTTGADKDKPFWTVQVPVSYAINPKKEQYGRWKAYIPGPRQAAPWLPAEHRPQADSDLLPAGGVYMVDGTRKGPELLTPLAEG